jgi:hypothetical protein
MLINKWKGIDFFIHSSSAMPVLRNRSHRTPFTDSVPRLNFNKINSNFMPLQNVKES